MSTENSESSPRLWDYFRPALSVVLPVGALVVACLALSMPETPFRIAVLDGPEGAALEKAAAEYFPPRHIPYVFDKLSYDLLWEQECSQLWRRPPSHTDDLLLVDEPWLPLFKKSDGLREIKNVDDASDFFRAPLRAAYQVDSVDPGKVDASSPMWGVPFVANVQILGVNKDLSNGSNFVNALYDESTAADVRWNDLLREWDNLPKHVGNFGFLMRGNSRNPLLTDFMPIIREVSPESLPLHLKNQKDKMSPESLPRRLENQQDLQDLVDEKGKAEEAIKVLQQLERLSPPTFMSSDDFELSNYLRTRRIAYAILWSSQVFSFLAPSESENALQLPAYLKIAIVPGAQPESGTWLLSVPKHGQHSSQAFDFIKHETDAKAMYRRALDSNTTPPRREALSKLKRQHKLDGDSEKVLELSLDLAELRSLDSEWEWYRRIISQELTAVSLGVEDPKEAVGQINMRAKDAQRRFQKLLKAKDENPTKADNPTKDENVCKVPPDLIRRLPGDLVAPRHSEVLPLQERGGSPTPRRQVSHAR